MFKKPLAFWLASDASEAAASFAWLPACCAASLTFEMASPALARMSCATPDAVDWFSVRDEWDIELLDGDIELLEGVELLDGDIELLEGVELLEGEEYWLFIGFSTTSTNVACL
jgi:hypothetical protein